MESCGGGGGGSGGGVGIGVIGGLPSDGNAALASANRRVLSLEAELSSVQDKLSHAAEAIRKGFASAQHEKKVLESSNRELEEKNRELEDKTLELKRARTCSTEFEERSKDLEERNTRLMAIVDAMEAEAQQHLEGKQRLSPLKEGLNYSKMTELTLEDLSQLLSMSFEDDANDNKKLKDDTREGRGRAARAFVKFLTPQQRRAMYAACAKVEEEQEEDQSAQTLKAGETEDPMLMSLGEDIGFSDIPNSLYLGAKSMSDPLSDGASRRAGAENIRHPHRNSDPSHNHQQGHPFNLPSPEAVDSILQAYVSDQAAAAAASGEYQRSVGDLVSSSVLDEINADGDDEEGGEGAAAAYEAVERTEAFVPVDLTTRFGYEQIMTHFYLRHNPDKIGLINLILVDYKDEEEELFVQMFGKYNLNDDEWVTLRANLENDLDGSKAKRFGRTSDESTASLAAAAAATTTTTTTTAPIQLPSPQKYEKAGAVRKSGWLEKKNRNGRKKMAKRFFKLLTKYEEHQTPVILYYSSDQSKKEKGTILLEGCEIVDTSQPTDVNANGAPGSPASVQIPTAKGLVFKNAAPAFPLQVSPVKGVWTFEVRHPTRETRLFKAADSASHNAWVTMLKKVLEEFNAENEILDRVDPKRIERRRSSLALAEAVYRQTEDDDN